MVMMIDLDHNATTPLRGQARAAWLDAGEAGGNASSVHAKGRAARGRIERARAEVAMRMGVDPGAVVFTSGGTESCALALHGAVQGAAQGGHPVTHLLVSAIEHDCVRASARAVTARHPGLHLTVLPVTADGVVDLDVLQASLRDGGQRSLVCVMAANNETGAIQPVAEIRELTAAAHALFFCDAVQAAGRMDIPADLIALSAHKLGGPQGAGALIVRDDVPFAAQQLGGGQEKWRRAGTENVAAIAGFGAVCSLDTRAEQDRLEALRARFEDDLRTAFADVVVFADQAPRLANTSNFALPGLSAQTAVLALDLDGIALSAGAACASGKVTRSHVLGAMGVAPELAEAALRVSFGWTSHDSDGAAAIHSLYKLRQRAAARAAA